MRPLGGYVFADYYFNTRCNAGGSYEHWQDATTDKVANQAFKVFAGFSLLEETTAFRFDWDHTIPGTPSGGTARDAVNTTTFRVIYSMGPHKAHQF